MPVRKGKSKQRKIPTQRFVIEATLGPGEAGDALTQAGRWYAVYPEGGFALATADVDSVALFRAPFGVATKRLFAEAREAWQEEYPGLWVYSLSEVVRRGGKLIRRFVTCA